MYIYSLIWSLSIAVVAYNIGNRLELIDPIYNPIETIFLKFVIPLLAIPFSLWRNENKK